MRFGIIGCGKMGYSILSGMIKKGIFKKQEIYVFDTFKPTCKKLEEEGFNVSNSVQNLVDCVDSLLLSVKPQELNNVFNEITNAKNVNVISIMAGVKIEKISTKFTKSKIARVMPNTCAMIGKSASSVCFSQNCDQPIKDFFINIISSFGSVNVIDESIMDEVIPLAGSFTAYAYYYAKSFIESAQSRKVPYDVAVSLVANSMIGSAEMILHSGKDIETLIKDVCSKGGTTLAGLEELEKGNLKQIVDNCCISCANRSKELGKN